jgi:hypothetical protein
LRKKYSLHRSFSGRLKDSLTNVSLHDHETWKTLLRSYVWAPNLFGGGGEG